MLRWLLRIWRPLPAPLKQVYLRLRYGWTAVGVAALIRDERGRILREPLTISVGGVQFSLSKSDVDMLQRAKAAVAAGIAVLCRRAGLRFAQIGSVHVAGSFGEHLDVGNAERIGLLPSFPAARVHLAGNTALKGALDLLLSDEAETALSRTVLSATLINLSMEEEFEELFLDHLYVRPVAERLSHGRR